MELRRATIDDLHLLFQWRNDPLAIKMSLSVSQIDIFRHENWLKRMLNNPTKHLLIAEVDGIPVGTVKAEKETSGVYSLSWTVAPEHRNKGFGKQMLILFMDYLKDLSITNVKAVIRSNNIASIKMAECAGLTLSRIDNELLFYS